jgi:DNA polymerase-3 subunit gamma/tau
MLSKDAWGALLKTLEEPPRHVIFILATTEFEKVPETIISRCQIFTFRKPTDAILKNRILDITEKEGFELDSDSAELIAILGDGSFRDTEGVLQKVLNNQDKKSKKISKEEIEKITGAPKTILIREFLSAIVENKIEDGIVVVQKASSEGLDMQIYLKLIIQKFRLALILRYASKLENSGSQHLAPEDLEFLKYLIKKDSSGKLCSATLSILLEAYQDINNAFISELPLELALIQILEQDK